MSGGVVRVVLAQQHDDQFIARFGDAADKGIDVTVEVRDAGGLRLK